MTADDTTGTTRDQAIEQFAQGMFSEMGEVGEWEQTWDDLTESSQSQWLVVAERLADAGLLRGGGDTAEVAKLQAERDQGPAGRATYQAALQPAFDYMIAKTYTMAYGSAGAAQAVGVLVRDVAIEADRADRAVAERDELAAKVRALADKLDHRMMATATRAELRALLDDGGGRA